MLAWTLALALPVCGVTREEASRRELAELHSNHILVDGHRHELAAVVDVERQSDELRQDRRPARPGLDRLALASFLRSFRFLKQRKLDERAFPDGASHYFFLAWRDRMIILSVALL